MSKKKLTDAQIIEIAIAYANSEDSVTQSKFSEKYKISKTLISDALHSAISECLINEATSILIKQKAVRNEKKKMNELKLPKCNKTARLYDELLIKHKKKRIEKELNENYEQIELNLINYDELLIKHKKERIEEELNENYEQIELNLINYDELYSQNDEYPYTKEELEKQLDLAKRKILEYKNNNEI